MAQIYGAAAEFAQREFGGIIAHTFSIQSIGTTFSSVVGNDPERVSIFVQNLSANTIYLGYDQAVSSSRGIILPANGGGIGFNAKDDQILSTLALFTVATGALSDLLVLTQRRIRATNEEEN